MHVSLIIAPNTFQTVSNFMTDLNGSINTIRRSKLKKQRIVNVPVSFLPTATLSHFSNYLSRQAHLTFTYSHSTSESIRHAKALNSCIRQVEACVLCSSTIPFQRGKVPWHPWLLDSQFSNSILTNQTN